MMRRNDDGNRWTGALLLAVQLVALLLLPVLHSPAGADDGPAAVTRGAPADVHSEATCSICRLAGLRYMPPIAGDVATARPALDRLDSPPPHAEYRTVARLTSIAARAPPISC